MQRLCTLSNSVHSITFLETHLEQSFVTARFIDHDQFLFVRQSSAMPTCLLFNQKHEAAPLIPTGKSETTFTLEFWVMSAHALPTIIGVIARIAVALLLSVRFVSFELRSSPLLWLLFAHPFRASALPQSSCFSSQTWTWAMALPEILVTVLYCNCASTTTVLSY